MSEFLAFLRYLHYEMLRDDEIIVIMLVTHTE